jgi:hypothetical protein
MATGEPVDAELVDDPPAGEPAEGPDGWPAVTKPGEGS